MKIRFLPLCLLVAIACEPIDKVEPKTEEALSTESETGGNTNTSVVSATTLFFNLSSALRTQYLQKVIYTFNNLSISIDGEKCSLSYSLGISLPGEISSTDIDAAFTSIQSKIEECMGTGDERVKIKGIDLYDFEKDIEKALGDDVVKACTADADCGRLPYGGYFRSGLGFIYSKKIQGQESINVQNAIRDLMIDLADSESTDYDGFNWAVEGLPEIIPVPRCVNNVCKGVNP